MKKKQILTALAACFLTTTVWGTQPLRRPFTVKQADGTTLTVSKRGNSRFHYLVTTDGLALLPDAAGNLCYAELAGDSLRPSAVVAHETDGRTPAELAFVAGSAITSSTAYATLSQKTAALQPRSGRSVRGAASTDDGLGRYGQSSGAVVSSIGSPVIPVIMVEFPDMPFQPGTTEEKITRLFNEPGYADEEYSVGSVADYFADQSNGLFTPRFEVVARVQAANGYAHYGADGTYTTDPNAAELIEEAIGLARQAGTDFSKYAQDGNVPLVTIYYAGPGEHSAYEEGWEDYLWAHYNELIGVSADGVGISSYFIGNELLQDYTYENGQYVVTGSNVDGIGVFCHEFSHALGLPDFYSTDNVDGRKTPDYWSVMDYGQYWANGYAPIGYSAYERSFMGWLDVSELTDQAAACRLYPFGSDEGPTAYVLRAPNDEKEYFLLENRQPGRWYPAGLGHGMLVTHVYYSSRMWNMNTVNNSLNRLRYTVVPADGEWQSSQTMTSATDFRGDLFPGFTSNTEFTDDTTPAPDLFSGGKLGKPLYNIAESDEGVISFSYLDRNATGIDALTPAASDGPVTVYATDGRRVLSAGSREAACRLLAPGTYIVTGTSGTNEKICVK